MATSNTSRIAGGLLAAAATLVLAAPLQASDLVGPDVSIRYADLDIDTVEGATQLLKRINSAADSVCARLDHGDLASAANSDRCKSKLTSAAVARVNNPVLAAVYKSAHPSARTVAAVAD